MPIVLAISSCNSNSLNADLISKISKSITVRVEGSTQGSGTIISSEYDKNNNLYLTKILTAGHIVGANSSQEEFQVVLADKSKYKAFRTERLFNNIDLAEIEFLSKVKIKSATLDNSNEISTGDKVYIGGYPLQTTAVTARIFRFLKGDIVAKSDECIQGGYQLLYDNKTMPGMSGSPILNKKANVIGIHGRGETSATLTEQTGIAIKTGTNQGVPIQLIFNPLMCIDGTEIGGSINPNDKKTKVFESTINSYSSPHQNESKNSNLASKEEHLTPYPLAAINPNENQVQALLQVFLNRKATALRQNGDTQSLAEVARPVLVGRVRDQQADLLRDGLVQKVQASITSIQTVSSTLSRIEVRAQLTYRDRTLNNQGEVVDETPAGNLPVTYILGRDPDGWRLQAYIPG